MQRTRIAARLGFTLPELLTVMMLIAVLLGMILSAIRAIHRHALRTVALGEVKGIESAWKQYYAHYQDWPDLADTPAEDGLSEDTTYLINHRIALVMHGDENYGNVADDDKVNPDDIPLMEFIHFDKKNGENNNPINPWGLTVVDVNRCYYVRFDHDGDGRISLPRPDSEPSSRTDENWRPESYTDEGNGGDESHFVRAGVIVWTYNPEIHVGDKDGNDEKRDEERIIGSWKD